jgi:hypothetical protein
MPKTKITGSMKALAYLRFMELKNNLALMLREPSGIIGAIFKVFMAVIPMVWLPFMLHRNGLNGMLFSFHIPVNIISAVIMLFLIAISVISLKKASESYYPTQYSAADANLLFTSPISSRHIYAGSIIQQIITGLSGSLLMALSLFLMLKISNIAVKVTGVVYAFAGIILFVMIVQTLNFFLYAVSKRFNIAPLVKTLIFISFGVLFANFGISLFGSADILQSTIDILNGRIFTGIPVIGWTHNLIMSLLIPNTPVTSLMALSSFTILMLFITVGLATDYYEEAIVSTERMAKIRTAVSRNNIEEVQQLISRRKQKVKRIRFQWNFQKAHAFLWKAIVVNRRKSKGAIAEIMKYAFFAVIGGVFGYVFRNQSYQAVTISIIVLGAILKKGNASSLEGLEYELKKNYIFLLPGRARNKILALNIIPVIKLLARNWVMIVPMALFLKLNVIQLSSFWVILSAISFMNQFTEAVIQVIVPYKERKNMLFIYLRYLIEILLQFPAVGVGMLFYFQFKNIEAAIFGFGVCSVLTVIGLLSLSETLLSRLELND